MRNLAACLILLFAWPVGQGVLGVPAVSAAVAQAPTADGQPFDREYILEASMLGYRGVGGDIDGVRNPVLRAKARERVRITTRRLRALWALHITEGLRDADLVALLDDRDEYVRAWAVQLLAEDQQVPQQAVARMTTMAREDQSPLVRLYLAAGLQRMPLDQRWEVLTALAARAEDEADHNLPLMVWYAAEPMATADAVSTLAGAPGPDHRSRAAGGAAQGTEPDDGGEQMITGGTQARSSVRRCGPTARAALLLLAGLATGCAPSAAPPAAAGGEWVPLFDGETLNGWEGNFDFFRVEQGAIVGGRGGEPIPRNEFLCRGEEVGDFELRTQFRLDPGVNSGVQIRSRRIPGSHETIGYQADLGDRFWGALYDESRRNRVLAEPTPAQVDRALRRGEWNQYRIVAQGPRVQLFINGTPTVDYTEPDASVEQRGQICLQIHSGPPGEVRFRDLQFRELPPGPHG
jgi:hypothetical protein